MFFSALYVSFQLESFSIEKMADRRSEREAGKRFPKGKRFPEGSWKVLEDIIVNGEDGRFFEILHDRSPSANMARADVWNSITILFNEVSNWVKLVHDSLSDGGQVLFVGYNAKMSKSLSLTQMARIRYEESRDEGYIETGVPFDRF